MFQYVGINQGILFYMLLILLSAVEFSNLSNTLDIPSVADICSLTFSLRRSICFSSTFLVASRVICYCCNRALDCFIIIDKSPTLFRSPRISSIISLFISMPSPELLVLPRSCFSAIVAFPTVALDL